MAILKVRDKGQSYDIIEAVENNIEAIKNMLLQDAAQGVPFDMALQVRVVDPKMQKSLREDANFVYCFSIEAQNYASKILRLYNQALAVSASKGRVSELTPAMEVHWPGLCAVAENVEVDADKDRILILPANSRFVEGKPA